MWKYYTKHKGTSEVLHDAATITLQDTFSERGVLVTLDLGFCVSALNSSVQP